MSAKEQLPPSIKNYFRQIKLPDLRKTFLELYFYIKKVSDEFEISLSEAEVLDIFGVDTFKMPEKSDINKKLFEHAKVAATVRELGDFDNKIVEALTSSFFNKNQNKDSLLQNIRTHQNQISTYNDRIRNSLKSIVEWRKELANMDNIDNSAVFLREMNKIINSQKFEQIYFHTRGNWLCAVTKPVNIRFDEHDYSFGQYVIAFSPHEKNFIVLPHKNNILVDGADSRYHPHVFDQKNICWGNASATFSELMANQKIGDLFLIANMIIHAYNKDSPVNMIDDYKSRARALTVNNFRRYTDFPIHFELLLELNPSLENDETLFKAYGEKYVNVHNFHYETPSQKKKRLEEEAAQIAREELEKINEIAQTEVA